MMEYKGYTAGPIDFDPDDKTFSGTVAGLRDVIHFEGTTATELARAFRESIDSYLELCAEDGPAARPPFQWKDSGAHRAGAAPQSGLTRGCRGRKPEPLDFSPD